MRTLLHTLVGGIAGFGLGVLGPMAVGLLFWHFVPEFRQGGGTPLALLTILTAPLGAIYGAAWGYQRASPPKTIIKRGPEQVLAEFERQFGTRPLEEQRSSLADVFPSWMAEYRRWVNPRLLVIAVLSYLPLAGIAHGEIAGPIVFWAMICGGYTISTAKVVWRVRSALQTARDRWGAEFVDSLPTHWTLRPRSR